MSTARHTPIFPALAVTEPQAWHAARARGEAIRPGMQMSPQEGALLHFLVTTQRACRVLEIGSFMGLSALWMARALPADGVLITLERDAAAAALAREHTREDARIRVIEGDALASLQGEISAYAPFDVCFIDAEKRAYAEYLEAALPLLAPDALIIGDNTLLFGAMLGAPTQAVSPAALEGMRRFHTILADPSRFTSAFIPTHEGLTVARRRENHCSRSSFPRRRES